MKLDLTTSEATRLSELEARVEEGIAAFITTGQALAEIRDSRLYRADHDTFEEYLDARWSYSRRRGYELIEAAEVAGVCAIAHTEPPANEGQARALAPLKADPPRLRAAVETAQATAAAEHRKPTAKDYAAAVKGEVMDDPTPAPQPAYTSCPTCGHRVRADKPLRPRGGTTA